MPKRYLISRLSSLGDVVCSLPAATALKRADPECEITWIVDPRFKTIVECCASVDHVLTPDQQPEGAFDAALDLQGLLKSALPIAKAKAKTKLGYHWQREGAWLFTQRVLPDPSSFHIVDQYVDVARAAGGQSDQAEFGLLPKPKDVESVQTKLGTSERIVVMNPGAGWVTKRWPTASFARVIDELEKRSIRSVLIGGRGEQQIADELISQTSGKPIKLTGQTSIGELVALLSLAAAHLGGDTGSTHIAGALGTPAVGLYSITRPQRSCPYRQVERCLHNPKALADIPWQDAYAKLEEALA